MPLGPLDEFLAHQTSETFDHVGTSDPRFYDRYWFCCYDPAGELAVIIGMGLYNNMNVLDGFVALQQPVAADHPARRTVPALSSVRQDLETGADALVDLLFRKIAGEAVESVMLEPQLVVRGSTASD